MPVGGWVTAGAASPSKGGTLPITPPAVFRDSTGEAGDGWRERAGSVEMEGR